MKQTPKHKAQRRVLYCILDNRVGGPHRLALTVARQLTQDGIETSFLIGRKTGDSWQPDGARVFQLKCIQCFQRRRPLLNLVRFIGWLPWNLLRIWRIIGSNRIDIVHIDGVTNFVPALAARLTRTPIVWLYNDHLLGPLKRLLLPLLTALSTVVIVQGEKLKESRTGDTPKLHRKTTVLYSSVDTHRFDPDRYSSAQRERLRRELGIPPDCAVVGMVGNVNRFKGYTYFIRAAKKIKETIGSVKFLVVGRKLDTDGGYWEQLQQLTRQEGLEDDIIYTGFREDTAAVMAILDVFVLASVLESCPIVVLEAMAMQVPVVATDVGAVSELVLDGQTGTVVPSKDAEALCEAVLAYLAMPQDDRDKITSEARKRVETEFSVDRIAEQQRRIYEGLRR